MEPTTFQLKLEEMGKTNSFASIGKRCGVSSKVISGWRKGVLPHAETRAKLRQEFPDLIECLSTVQANKLARPPQAAKTAKAGTDPVAFGQALTNYMEVWKLNSAQVAKAIGASNSIVVDNWMKGLYYPAPHWHANLLALMPGLRDDLAAAQPVNDARPATAKLAQQQLHFMAILYREMINADLNASALAEKIGESKEYVLSWMKKNAKIPNYLTRQKLMKLFPRLVDDTSEIVEQAFPKKNLIALGKLACKVDAAAAPAILGLLTEAQKSGFSIEDVILALSS